MKMQNAVRMPFMWLGQGGLALSCPAALGVCCHGRRCVVARREVSLCSLHVTCRWSRAQWLAVPWRVSMCEVQASTCRIAQLRVAPAMACTCTVEHKPSHRCDAWCPVFSCCSHRLSDCMRGCCLLGLVCWFLDDCSAQSFQATLGAASALPKASTAQKSVCGSVA